METLNAKNKAVLLALVGKGSKIEMHAGIKSQYNFIKLNLHICVGPSKYSVPIQYIIFSAINISQYDINPISSRDDADFNFLFCSV